MSEMQMPTKETLIQTITSEIKVHEKRFHQVKVRIFKDALDFLNTFEPEKAYELIAYKRDDELDTQMSHASAEILDGYDDLSKIFKTHFREVKRAAKVQSQG